MGTITQKILKLSETKAAIKTAIEGKGQTVGDIPFDEYAAKIEAIANTGSSGTGTSWTGHADSVGLAAIGWTADDIAYYQANGVNWNEEDDDYHKVRAENIALYGVINANNISLYLNQICYLPKIDTSSVTDMSNMFSDCYSLVAIPLLDTSSVTNMSYMFSGCNSLTTIPLLDTSSVTNMSYMFISCYSLVAIPLLYTSSVTDMNGMFSDCYSLVAIPLLDTSSVTDMNGMFSACVSLTTIPLLDTSSVTDMSYMFTSRALYLCYLDNVKISFILAYSSIISKASLLYIINNAQTVSGETMTLGSTNLDKLTNAEKQIATDKGWTLV
jgi:surface protein